MFDLGILILDSQNGLEWTLEQKKIIFFKVLDKNSNSSLVEMKPITGRKHQLRKQLFNLGNSIIGDKKYNSTNKNR